MYKLLMITKLCFVLVIALCITFFSHLITPAGIINTLFQSPISEKLNQMSWVQKTISLPALPRGCHLVTDKIVKQIPELSSFKVGLAHLFSIINYSFGNYLLAVRKDLEDILNRVVPEKGPYRHTMEGPDDMPAHAKASFLGSSVSIPITDGNFNLGTWQGIYLCEHRDSGGSRKIVVTMQGMQKRAGCPFSSTMGDSPHRRYTGLHEMFNQRQLEVKSWIENLVGERLIGDNLGVALKDGRILCRLITVIYPGCIDKWCDSDPIPRYKMIENINAFLQRCRALGVPEDKLFTAMDLFENRNLPLVVDCLLSLQMIVQTQQEIRRNTGYFGNPSLIPSPTQSNTSTDGSTGYFSSSPHSVPPPISNLPKPKGMKLATARKLKFNSFLREAIGDFKRFVLVPLFVSMSAGLGICAGRATYLKIAELCERLFTKSVSPISHALLNWYRLKTT